MHILKFLTFDRRGRMEISWLAPFKSCPFDLLEFRIDMRICTNNEDV